jgi:hypothetical protein
MYTGRRQPSAKTVVIRLAAIMPRVMTAKVTVVEPVTSAGSINHDVEIVEVYPQAMRDLPRCLLKSDDRLDQNCAILARLQWKP